MLVVVNLDPFAAQEGVCILPMSTGVPILPTQPAQITGRPQRNSERARSTATCSGNPMRAVLAWLLTTEQSSPHG